MDPDFLDLRYALSSLLAQGQLAQILNLNIKNQERLVWHVRLALPISQMQVRVVRSLDLDGQPSTLQRQPPSLWFSFPHFFLRLGFGLPHRREAALSPGTPHNHSASATPSPRNQF